MQGYTYFSYFCSKNSLEPPIYGLSKNKKKYLKVFAENFQFLQLKKNLYITILHGRVFVMSLRFLRTLQLFPKETSMKVIYAGICHVIWNVILTY